jgi:hypothetical protein
MAAHCATSATPRDILERHVLRDGRRRRAHLQLLAWRASPRGRRGLRALFHLQALVLDFELAGLVLAFSIST